MPSTGNLFEAPPLAPPPQAQPVQVSTFADEAKQNQQQAQMPPVYYGGKTGSAAFMADKVLTGWLAGTKMAQEKKAKTMADEVGAAKTGLDYIGQAYRAAVESGDDKKIQETKSALSEAYNDYLNKAEKYALPEQQMGKDGKPKKQGVGSKIKQGLMGGENPHLAIAHSTLEIMRKTDPTQLYGPSKQEQQQSKLLDMQTQQMEKQQASTDRWDKLNQTDPAKWSKEDKQFNEFYEHKYFGRTKQDQLKDDLLDKVAKGTQLNDQERQLAESFGFIKPKVVSTQLRTIQDAKGNPQTQLVSIGPDGKLVGTQELPGKDYVGPNQAQLAGQMINAQMGAMMKWGQRMHPEWDQKTPEGRKALTTWAMSTLYPPTAGTINWADEQQKSDVMNRALGAVIKRHEKEYKDPETGRPTSQPDDLANAILGNVVTTSDDGRYTYMPSLAPGQPGKTHWFRKDDPESWSGLTREQLNDKERKFQAELRAELKKQNPKMPDTYLDQLVPQALSRQQGGMQPPPGQAGESRAMTAPPHQRGDRGDYAAGALGVFPSPPVPEGEAWYRITLPDGSTPIRHMTKEYADALAARGATVVAVDQ